MPLLSRWERKQAEPLNLNLLFAGQYTDDESGLAYNLFRYYDPQSGCYLKSDPIGLNGGETPYAYVHNPMGWVDPFGLAKCKSSVPGLDPYRGVKEASKYLKKMGVPRSKRVKVLQSFDIETIKMKQAGNNEFGLRFYGGNAQPMGQFLMDTFSPLTNRSNLALPPKWNAMTGIKQWQIKPGTTMITGKVAPQLGFGEQYIGGANQIFVLEPWKYGSLF